MKEGRMAYYTERHGMRNPVAKTYDISIEKYTLLFHCCEKYYNNLAWKYPAQCPDGQGCCGLNQEQFELDLRYEIPILFRDSAGHIAAPELYRNVFSGGKQDEYDQYALIDFIELFAQNVRDITIGSFHSYWGHHHITCRSSNIICSQFRDEINDIFQKTGLLYELNTNLQVERIVENSPVTPTVESAIATVKETGTRELLQEAILLHRSPYPADIRNAVEKLWDAYERLKTYYTAMNKAKSAEKIVNDSAQESPIDELNITLGIFRNHLAMIDELLVGFNATKFYIGEPLERLTCLNRAAEYVQSNKELETRFMGLSRRLKGAYTICFPSGELTDTETAKAQFYLAIRSIIYKQTKGDAPDAEIMNRAVEEMVRNAIACTGIENIVDENKSVDLFSDEFIAELDAVEMPITKFNALLKLLRKAISSYGRTNKVKAQEFDERLRSVVEAYNSRDKLIFTSEVVADFVNDLSDQLLQILKDLQEDKTSFEKLGITFEEKAFYDILVKVRDDHGFPYADEKCLILAKKIKELVDDKAQFADWSTRDDIKNQLNMELTVLLYQNGYPPEWDEEVFQKVMEQAENFKKYSDK